MTKPRADYLPRECLFALHHGCAAIEKAWPDSYGVYLVGSALERPDYRDVDLRCILPDDDFDAEFPKNDAGIRERWQLMTWSLSAWLKSLTGLPIDFQFQRQSTANERHRGRRSALGYCVIGGDAIEPSQGESDA